MAQTFAFPCPNKCGDLLIFGKPIAIYPLEDMLDALNDYEEKLRMRRQCGQETETDPNNIPCVTVIEAACPKCGFALVKEATLKQAEAL